MPLGLSEVGLSSSDIAMDGKDVIAHDPGSVRGRALSTWPGVTGYIRTMRPSERIYDSVHDFEAKVAG